jgi:predicted nucleic acid-binding protein
MALLERVAEDGAFAPQLWPLEVVNGLLIAQRRGRIDAAKRRHLAGVLRALPISIDEETGVQVWSATQTLADSHRLSIYDAAYLELALRLGIPLATGDRALAAATRALGAPLLPAT